MKRSIFKVIILLVLGCNPTEQGAATLSNIHFDSGNQTVYAVGVKSFFFHNPEAKFDPWGKKYKSESYRSLLQKIEAAGDIRTVHANIYYPAERTNALSQDLKMLPKPLFQAKNGVRATELDFFEGNKELYQARGGSGAPQIKRQSYKGADLAKGKFPLIVMIHGLGDGHNAWNRAAEYMTSQGYIVATIAYTSDSGSTPVFEDPSSNYARTRSKEELIKDYQLLHSAGTAVFSNFFMYLYGEKVRPSSPHDFPDINKLKAVKGGGAKACKMMAGLFEQRTEDLATVIKEIKLLNANDNFFQGSIDVENIGVMGHSLGSITTQSALVNIPEVKTGVAFNNGLPKSWEPYGGFPNDSGNSFQPDGVPKDILFVIGSDDNFIHMVFKEIFYKWFESAGGDIQETMPLVAEQVWPTADNPQPVALSSYHRAQAAKMFLSFKDQHHGSTTDNATFTPGEKLTGRRVPLDHETISFEADTYEILGWKEQEGVQEYLPHTMRNWFIKAWFDWQLKADDTQTEHLINHPFGSAVKQLLYHGLE